MQVVAVDAGTSLIKAIRYEGEPAVASARRAVPLVRGASGEAEQSMAAVWSATAEAVAEVATAEVELLAVTAQGDGCWLIDPDGEPVGEALLWSDGRATAYVEAWQRSGVADRGHEVNGLLAFPGSPAALLAWLSEHQPQRLARAATATTCGGWLNHRLTGRRQAEWSDASHPFARLDVPEYDPAMLDLLGLTEVERLLAPIVRSERSAAPLTRTAAQRLGLRAGIPVVQAPYDVPASAFGAGCTTPGDGFAVLGTALISGTLQERGAPRTATETIAFGFGDLLLGFHPSLAGAELLTWAAELTGVADPAALVGLAAESQPGAGGVLALPYLSPAGERAPFTDPTARGALLGLTYATTRADVARALVEALALVVRDCLGVDGDAPVALCGGGATSELWCQTIADALQRPVRRSAGLEAGARGAWLAGRIAVGDLDLAAAALSLPAAASFDADADLASLYDRQHGRSLDARRALGMGAR